jgi:hypothetical protein
MRRRLALYEVCFGSRAQRLKAALLLSRDALPLSTLQASSASSFHAKLGVQELKQEGFYIFLFLEIVENRMKSLIIHHYPVLSSTSA